MGMRSIRQKYVTGETLMRKVTKIVTVTCHSGIAKQFVDGYFHAFERWNKL